MRRGKERGHVRRLLHRPLGGLFAMAAVVAGARLSARADGVVLPPTEPGYSPDEQRVFEEFQRDAEEYTGEQQEYRKTLGDIVRRTYDQQKADMQAKYAAELDTLDKQAETQRLDTMAVLRNFLELYPNDKTWTPDVEFRLALLTFDEETRAKTNGGDLSPTTLPTARTGVNTYYPKTIALLLDLIQRFPDYRFIDQAEFSLGYAINPTDTAPEAMPYYRAVVCPNKFKPTDPPPEFVGDEAYAEAAAAHRPAPPPPPPLPADIYDGCVPRDPSSPVLQETWIRVGEFHFDNSGQLAAAEQAYKHATDAQGDAYDFAVYKLGWTYFRDNRFTDAIKAFDEDITWSDKRVKEGKEPSDTREEAVRYIAFCFQDSDWDNDGKPDATPGYAKMDEFYKDRWQEPHVKQVYLGLAKLYHEFGEYPNSAHTYELIQKHWPYDEDAPELQEAIAEEYAAAHDEQAATNAREELGKQYGRDSDWAAHNKNNPDAIEHAQDLARNSLLIGADSHRKKAFALIQDAQHQRDRQVAMSDNVAAVEEYTYAADGYAAYVRRYPNSPDTYKVTFFMAQSYDGAGQLMPAIGPTGYAQVLEHQATAASQSTQVSSSQPASMKAPLFASDYNSQLKTDEEMAAEGYEWVRDHRDLAPAKFDKSTLAADYACSVREGVVAQDQALGLYTVPPTPDNDKNRPPLPIAPQPIPADQQRLLTDYDSFAKAYPDDKTTPGKELDAAIIEYKYLHWEDEKGQDGQTIAGARTRFAQIRQRYCGKSKEADDAGQALLASYVIVNDLDKMDATAQMLQKQQCGADLSHNTQLANIEAGVAFKRADQLMQKGQCGDPNAPLDVPDCEAAAEKYLEIVKAHPDFEHAGFAVQNAAVAYEHIHEYDKSIALYEQLFDPKGPYVKSKEVDVGAAIFFAAQDHKRFFEFDDALREYKLLFDPKYKGNQYQLQAMIAAAILEEGQQQYVQAADLYKRIADMPGVKPEEGVDAYQSAARCYQDAKATGAEMATLRELINRARGIPKGGDYVMHAEFREAEIAQETHDRAGALALEKKVVDDYKTMHVDASGPGAEYAAHAFFDLALDAYTTKYKKAGLHFNPDDNNQKRQRETVLANQTAAAACEKSFVPLFAAALGGDVQPPPEVQFNRAEWMFAGWYMAGQCWQDLGDLYQNAPLPRALSSFAQEAQDAYTQAINSSVQKYDNNAQNLWKNLIKVAQAIPVSNDWTKRAIKQMNGYDPADYPVVKDAKVDLALEAPVH